MKNYDGKLVKVHFGTRNSVPGKITRTDKHGRLVVETNYGIRIKCHLSQVQIRKV